MRSGDLLDPPSFNSTLHRSPRWWLTSIQGDPIDFGYLSMQWWASNLGEAPPQPHDQTDLQPTCSIIPKFVFGLRCGFMT